MEYKHRIAIRKEVERRYLADKGAKIREAEQAEASLGVRVAPKPPLSLTHFTNEVHLGFARLARTRFEAARPVTVESRQARRHRLRRETAAATRKTPSRSLNGDNRAERRAFSARMRKAS